VQADRNQSIQTQPEEHRGYTYLVFSAQGLFWYRITRLAPKPFLLNGGGFNSIEQAQDRAIAMIDSLCGGSHAKR
jgi:hypothetical protein